MKDGVYLRWVAVIISLNTVFLSVVGFIGIVQLKHILLMILLLAIKDVLIIRISGKFNSKKE